MTNRGYDIQAELGRYHFADLERGGVRINRGTAKSEVAEGDPPAFEEVRRAHRLAIVQSTLSGESPVVELDRPSTGIYVGSRRGVYLDLYQGVAQRLFDDDRLMPRMQPLISSGLLLRREINTDDYLGFAPEGVRLPQDVAALVTSEMSRAFPRPDGYSVFFSNSGTEAVEAAVKASALFAYRRFIKRFGAECWADVCRELGIERDVAFGETTPVWKDYPLFFVALEGAFHGRTLGSLALTQSRPVQRIGFPAWRWVVHVSRDSAAGIERRIDRRPIAIILQDPGELARTIAAGRVPVDLLAAALFEPLQGEGGYRSPSGEVLAALRELCDDTGAQLIADEVQTFARGGATFYSEIRSLRPDIVALAKAAVMGMTIVPNDLARNFERGWHSNTFGSGRLFDVNYSHAVIDTFVNGRDATFAGLTFAENEAIKGEYLHDSLEKLAEQFPSVLSGFDGRGCIWGFTVPDRPAFLSMSWRQGAKMLGAGGSERPGQVRLILPADVLTREIDDVVACLRRTCEALPLRPTETPEMNDDRRRPDRKVDEVVRRAPGSAATS